MLPLYLCDFQITHSVNPFIVHQLTNYHDTTNHSEYLPQLELLQSCDLHAANLYVPKYYRTFDSPKYFIMQIEHGIIMFKYILQINIALNFFQVVKTALNVLKF